MRQRVPDRSAMAQVVIRTSALVKALQPDRVGRAARVRAGLEHAALLVGEDGADRAREPGPLRPPFDLVAETAERRTGCLVDAPFEIEPSRMIGMRLERGGEAVGGDARGF